MGELTQLGDIAHQGSADDGERGPITARDTGGAQRHGDPAGNGHAELQRSAEKEPCEEDETDCE